MAAMNFSFRPLELSTSTAVVNHRKPATFLHRKPSISISFATTSPETTATSPVEKPAIELEFIGPKPGADGKPLVDRAKAISGEKLLRNIMLDNKIELYASYIKVGWNRLRSLPNVGKLEAPKKGSIQYIHNVLHRAFLSPEGLDGKVMNCGGGGSCGTCIVEIMDGKDLLNERTNTELKYLKKKPESWRLACQTIVGNKENSGKVVVQRLPQWKK